MMQRTRETGQTVQIHLIPGSAEEVKEIVDGVTLLLIVKREVNGHDIFRLGGGDGRRKRWRREEEGEKERADWKYTTA